MDSLKGRKWEKLREGLRRERKGKFETAGERKGGLREGKGREMRGEREGETGRAR